MGPLAYLSVPQSSVRVNAGWIWQKSGSPSLFAHRFPEPQVTTSRQGNPSYLRVLETPLVHVNGDLDLALFFCFTQSPCRDWSGLKQEKDEQRA